jgi:hypothetical protein
MLSFPFGEDSWLRGRASRRDWIDSVMAGKNQEAGGRFGTLSDCLSEVSAPAIRMQWIFQFI